MLEERCLQAPVPIRDQLADPTSPAEAADAANVAAQQTSNKWVLMARMAPAVWVEWPRSVGEWRSASVGERDGC